MKFSGFLALSVFFLALLLVFGCAAEKAGAVDKGSLKEDSAAGEKETVSDDSEGIAGGVSDSDSAGINGTDINGVYSVDSNNPDETMAPDVSDEGSGTQDANALDSNSSGSDDLNPMPYADGAAVSDGNDAQASDGSSGGSLSDIYG